MLFKFDHLQQSFVLRQLRSDDARTLGAFFDSLSAQTKQRFAPHPLTAEHAAELCKEARPNSETQRWIVTLQENNEVLGYFILDTQMSPHERTRYQQQGIELQQGDDWLFAPVIADNWQNRGLASATMPLLLTHAKTAGARSLVLLGGTQETNLKGIAFYRKFGFEQHGGYQTEIYNLDMRALL